MTMVSQGEWLEGCESGNGETRGGATWLVVAMVRQQVGLLGWEWQW